MARFRGGYRPKKYPTDGSISEAEFFKKANIESLPRFFENAKAAGISRAVYIGSLYSFVAPQVMERIPYVRSRHLSDAAVRALSGRDFNVVSLAWPGIVGFIPGLPVAQWEAQTAYAQGRLNDMPDFAPPGGLSFMTAHSVAEAVHGGLQRGESGESYLVGDINLSWKAFFELWFGAAGRPRDLEVRRGHPLMPDFALSYIDFGATDYEPMEAETTLLGYQRGLIPAEVKACVRYYGKPG